VIVYSVTKIPFLLLSVLAVFFQLSLGGCITSTTGGFSDSASPDKALERRVELARNYIGEGNWQDAKRNLSLAEAIDPDNAEVHEAFALVYQSTGEYELAEENFKKAIAIQSGFSRARNNYAVFLFSQARYEDAEVQLEAVVQDTLYNSRPQAYINLGLCRLQLFDHSGAEKAFVRALSMDNSSTIALLETALLRFEAEDYPSASQYYNRYRKFVRQQSPRGLWLGVRLAKETGDQNALSSFSMALSSLYPESAEYQAYKRSNIGD
jgi:type IV pilus assembly protein PilF